MGILDLFSSKPTPAKFATLMSDAIRQQGITESIRFDEDAFSLVIGSDGSQVFNLYNAYNDYCRAAKGDRAQIIAEYATGFPPPTVPASLADARANLLPILRNRAMPEFMRLDRLADSDDPGDVLAALPFSEDTVLMLAHDGEHALQTLGAEILKEWSVNIEDCLPIALDNLRERSVSRFEQVAPGVFVGTWSDSYDTSRLLLPDLVYQLDLGGEPVMMIPTRGCLLATSANNLAGMLLMVDLAQRFGDEEARQVSTLMYRFENGRPVQYVPDEEVAAALKPMQLKTIAFDYRLQKERIDKFHERKGIDMYVADCELMRGPDGNLVTMSVWTEDVATLLPKTDMVVLNRLDAAGQPLGMLAVHWDELASKTGALVLFDSSYPPRYRTTDFPSTALCETLTTIEL